MELGWDLRLWEGAVKEERFLHPRSPFTSWEISQDRKEVSEAQKIVHQPARLKWDRIREWSSFIGPRAKLQVGQSLKWASP